MAALKILSKPALFILYLCLCISSFLLSTAVYADPQNIAVVLTVDGAIGPATDDYIHRGIIDAEKKSASIIIIQMDTPGGLDKSMRAIIKHILSSPIPVVTFVAPSGARAASAGTYILYASHIAAMAPGTNLGAATPIQFVQPTTPDNDKESKTQKPNKEQEKMINDAVAYITSLAELRDRNVAFAKDAVLNAATLSADQALKEDVINIIADDIPDLLQKINGKQVNIQGIMLTLDTSNLTIVQIQPDWRARLLAVITDPNIAYILLLIGIYGIFFEFANPGFIIPGVAGAIALLLALFALQLLPINYAGLGLIFLGLAFIVVEIFMPSFGALGIGGIIAFIAGSILLIDPSFQGYTIHWGLIIFMAIITAIFFFVVIGMAIRARQRAVISGIEELPGMLGIAMEDFSEEGFVKVRGESWRARTHVPIKKGQQIRVIHTYGLRLIVEPWQGD